jgi:hypothetical protein
LIGGGTAGGGSGGTNPGASKHYVVLNTAERDALTGLKAGDEITILDNGSGVREDWTIQTPGGGTWATIAAKIAQKARSELTQQAERAADFTAVVGGLYPVDTRLGQIFITPPGSPALEDEFGLIDSRRTWSHMSPATVLTSPDLTWGNPDDINLITPQCVIIRYFGTALGWLPT